ncbi:MAG: glycosyltransferase family 4 protein [Muribaculaceae bacterium]|nr:glycosyltransferase family 4 protein [Muribaculaceae bacterium]
MLDKRLTEHVLTIGPAPDMKGGIAQVINTYFSDIFSSPKFIAEIVNGGTAKRMATSVGAAFKLINRLNSDKSIRIVHLHTAAKVSFPRSAIYAKIAKMLGRKVVMHVHGSTFEAYFNRNKRRVRKTLQNCDAVVALSQSWLDFFKTEVGLDNVVILPNIVSEADVPAEQPVADSLTHLLFLGELGPRKGVYDLLDAVYDSRETLAGRVMLHIGGNGDTQKLEDTINRLGLDGIVRFEGWVSGEKKKELLRQCSIYVLPSYAEGLPISILEAMAYSHAIISTTVGGIPEVVDSTNGILVEPGDKKALAQAICTLAADPDKVKAMGVQSLSKVKPHFSSEVANELSQLYQRLLSE